MSQPLVRVSDPEVLERFKTYVVQKYGKLRGVMSKEVSNALVKYMENEEHIHAHTQSTEAHAHVKHGSRTIRNLATITDRILEETEKEIPQTRVEQIITETVGGDFRTQSRYLVLLNDYGVLKPVRRMPLSPQTRRIKFIYEVNLDEANKIRGVYA